jgi:hypothetical protein
MQMAATGIYSDNSHADVTTQVAWSSSDTVLATVGATTGKALAIRAGSATLSASLQGHSASTTLTVTAATLVSIAVSSIRPKIALGITRQLIATGTYTDNSTQDLTSTATWLSSAPSNLSLSNAAGSQGQASGVATGSASVSASLGTVTSPSLTLTVTIAQYAYVANAGDNTVSQYTIGAGGALSAMTPATVGTGSAPQSVTTTD